MDPSLKDLMQRCVHGIISTKKQIHDGKKKSQANPWSSRLKSDSSRRGQFRVSTPAGRPVGQDADEEDSKNDEPDLVLTNQCLS